MIDRIEILQDGASAIYGSDAIGGVINILTKQSFNGFQVDAQIGSYLSENDGESRNFSLLWGGGDDATHFVVSASYTQEKEIFTADRAQSAFPRPFATDCLGGGCSTFTPQGRIVLGPNFGFWDGTLNDDVVNDGTGSLPVFDPSNPDAGDFHSFSNADRFNFNGLEGLPSVTLIPCSNHLVTPWTQSFTQTLTCPTALIPMATALLLQLVPTTFLTMNQRSVLTPVAQSI